MWALAASLALGRQSAAAELNGYLQEAIAVRPGQGDILFHRQTMNTKFEHSFSRRVMLRVEIDIWRDDPDFMDERVRSRLREGYFRLRFRDFDLRLGRVQIAWGEADGVIVSDQVSPFDIENFIVPGFDEIRKGVDGAFFDYYFNMDTQLQALWISHFEPPDFPNPRSPWFPIELEELEQPGFDVELEPFTRPANTFRNSEYGIRLSGHPTAADWAVGYLRSFDDRPTLRIRPGDEPGKLRGVPVHSSFHLLTGNVVYPTHGVLLRMDLAAELDRMLQLEPPPGASPLDPRVLAAFDNEFVARHHVIRGLVGVDMKPDFSWWHQADASFQFVHEEVIDPHPFLAVPDSSDLVSILLRAAYKNETIKPWFFAITSLRGGDAWLQAKLDYEPWDNWRFTLEGNIFAGHAFDGNDGGIFGMFDDNDMLQASVRYSY